MPFAVNRHRNDNQSAVGTVHIVAQNFSPVKKIKNNLNSPGPD